MTPLVSSMNHRHPRTRLATFCLSILLTPSTFAQTPTANISITPQPTARHMVGVRAQLEKNLDAKKLKEGDLVIARPEVKIHVADGLDLDTNSLLIGRVDKVEPSIDRSDSAIAVTFYRVRVKDAKEVAIKATILWIGEPPDQLRPKVVSAPADRTTPGVGVEAGNSQVPPMQGYQGSEITGSAVRSDDNKQSNLPPGVAWQINAIAGVNFFSDIGRPDSGWFRSKRKNVAIPSGTVLAIAIMALPAGPAGP
jgi:hypothetical protein